VAGSGHSTPMGQSPGLHSPVKPCGLRCAAAARWQSCSGPTSGYPSGSGDLCLERGGQLVAAP